MNVFVVSSMDYRGEIIAEGERRALGPDAAYVNGQGPYSTDFMFLNTVDNKEKFRDFVARAKSRNNEGLKDFYETLNSMSRAP